MSGASFDWFPDWSSDTAVVVASGPSAKQANLETIKGKARVTVINNSWQLAPWADVLYAADSGWWLSVKGCREFRGLRVSQSDEAQKRYGIRLVSLVRRRGIVREPKGMIAAGSDETGAGANSGFQALNLVYQFGARRIVLVGYDMTAAHGIHWHGRHANGMNNPTDTSLARWARVLDAQAGYFQRKGIEVLNASPISALKNYPKVDLGDLF